MLSFGEEAEEFEPPASEKKKMKSTYDFMENAVPPPKELLEELKQVSPKEEKKAETVVSIQEKLKEKVRAAEERRKLAKEAEEKAKEEEKRIETPAEQRSNTIEKLKQDIRDISKITEEPVVEKKQKKKSLVELEREKYMSNKTKKKKKSNDKVDDSDVSFPSLFFLPLFRKLNIINLGL